VNHRIIEANLDSVILAPQLHIESYLQHANRPVFKHLLYDIPEWAMGVLPSHNLRQLSAAVASLDIEEDPYVISLRQQLLSAVPGPQQTRLDQRLSKTISKRDTYTHKGLKDLERAAIDICVDVGPWSADWFINKVITRAKKSAGPYRGMINAWQEKEKQYLYNILDSIDHHPPSYEPEYIVAGVTDKVVTLIECLQMEKAMTESTDETYSCLVFITRRDAVLALSEVLQHHPQTKDLFSIGCLVGSSESQYRKSFLDITRELAKQSQGDTLRDFRVGEKNLIVSTSVAEEGIDIQACGTVIRWDPPLNIVSWAQSRGRARRKKSTFVLMFDRSSTSVGLIQKWEQLERDMTVMYYADRENARRAQHVDPMDLDDDDDLMFRVESTG
jgi:endoribonuclease Dicer